MNSKEKKPVPAAKPAFGPETATRNLGVSLLRKVLSDIVLGFSALTFIGVLKLLQSLNRSIVLYGLETITTATLSLWLMFLVLSVIPNDAYERINTIEAFSIKQIALTVVGILLWGATFVLVSHLINSTVSGLGVLAES